MRYVVGIVFLFLLALAAAVGIWVLATWIIVWNVNDMLAVGVNFWNVFWTLLGLSMALGGTGAAVSRL
jgi:hypothetical protein